ncbi:MAG: hypothetical protein K2K25_04315 [Muribaculaceae bacterium]|nr:hypothetical protein [Muribaculaceae bacterium]MDE6696082.1 hypothetical protein [Muribaculaceae bacterium]
MKHNLYRCIAFSVILAISLACSIASGEELNVSHFFKEDFAKNPAVTMVSFSGKQTDWKGLTVYKSVSVSGDNEKADAIARGVKRDGAKADFKETSYREGKLYFGFYGLGGEGSNRKYLFYLDLRPKGKSKTTLVYIEGNWSADEVKEMITKKIK